LHTGLQKAVIGVSGGLDSTLALLVTTRTFQKLSVPLENIIAITMPGFGTTRGTYANALELMDVLHVSARTIDIRAACLQHFRDIGHDEADHDVTYENVQARERTQILMDIANKEGGLVIGTGDLSELALGWCTYNGDHMSMYAVNTSVPKTLVRFLIQWIAENEVDEQTKALLQRIIDTPISPELLPPDATGNIHQKTEDVIGPYELHDFFLYHFLRYGAPPSKILYLAQQAFAETYKLPEIQRWLTVFIRRFFSQQFKRSCLPDGPKVGTVSLSPRGDLRMPSDADCTIWLNDM
jgi:NAD+ synthase (glutamine-hydrolysing)